VSNSTQDLSALKRCSACSDNKSLDSFSPWKQSKDGRYCYCRPCAAAKAKAYNADPERRAIKAAAQRQRRLDPAKAQADRETSARWKKNNPEQAAAHNYTPQKLEYNRLWSAANPESRNRSARAYQERNPEIGKVSRERRRARQLDTVDSLTHAQWLDVLEQFNHACAYCLRTDLPLQIEHMTPLSRNGKHERENVVPSCPPCNYKKHTRTLLEFLAVGGKF
jgi:5-methylcytosine-specific restriction endonuclease McrA